MVEAPKHTAAMSSLAALNSDGLRAALEAGYEAYLDEPNGNAAMHVAFEAAIRAYLSALPAPSAVAGDGLAEPSSDWSGWRSIDTAPEDERVILATAGNWVGEAIMLRNEDTGEQEWNWVDTGKPTRHSLYGWQPLPSPISAPVLSDLRDGGFDGPTGAE